LLLHAKQHVADAGHFVATIQHKGASQLFQLLKGKILFFQSCAVRADKPQVAYRRAERSVIPADRRKRFFFAVPIVIRRLCKTQRIVRVLLYLQNLCNRLTDRRAGCFLHFIQPVFRKFVWNILQALQRFFLLQSRREEKSIPADRLRCFGQLSLIQAADTPAVLRNRMIDSFFLSDRLPGFSAAIGNFILPNCIKPIGIFCIFIRLRVELLFQLFLPRLCLFIRILCRHIRQIFRRCQLPIRTLCKSVRCSFIINRNRLFCTVPFRNKRIVHSLLRRIKRTNAVLCRFDRLGILQKLFALLIFYRPDSRLFFAGDFRFQNNKRIPNSRHLLQSGHDDSFFQKPCRLAVIIPEIAGNPPARCQRRALKHQQKAFICVAVILRHVLQAKRLVTVLLLRKNCCQRCVFCAA